MVKNIIVLKTEGTLLVGDYDYNTSNGVETLTGESKDMLQGIVEVPVNNIEYIIKEEA